LTKIITLTSTEHDLSPPSFVKQEPEEDVAAVVVQDEPDVDAEEEAADMETTSYDRSASAQPSYDYIQGPFSKTRSNLRSG
jgi:hypothetical protein